ncbi:DUF4407 domain-containing protein [Agromyces archimandritae]|uniref:DUF4407 domain-containing protein n=1 Tax=Agromyces archimandritae TaxID=2781962 RepID=A0A975IPL0_9MICO|nr:DUF4407 domain-containing protein [Agromyces archimandritae]QTX05705.1 DUF4407 domain-containing protein [Agromyces archimandritae]
MSRIGDTLTTLGGARAEVLERAPGDRQRYLAMGLVLLTTAAVSAASASFALAMALSAPLPVAILIGICWGGIILAIDRMLVVGLSRQPSAWANVLLGLPRVALALVIGVVVATPLTLQIFDREINAEVQLMNQEAKQAFEEKLATDPRYTRIPELQASIAELRTTIADGGRTPVDDDPDVAAAAEAVTAAQAAYDEANRVWVSELDGTEGTGIVGDGPITQSKKLDRDGKLAALETAKAALADARAAAEARIEDESATTVAQATADLETQTAQLASITAARDAEAATFDTAADESGGMLARLEALGRIGDRNAMLGFAHLMIALLFVCIELMPVLMKTLQNLMRPTAYEQISGIGDGVLVENARNRAEQEMRLVKQETLPRLDLAEYRAELRRESGRRVSEAYVAKQETAELEAVDEWAEQRAPFIAARTLRDWERETDTVPVSIEGRRD